MMRLLLLPFCILIDFSFDDDAASDAQPVNEVTTEGDALQETGSQTVFLF